MQESSAILNICEKVLGVLCIIIMIFIVQEKATFFNVGNGVCKIGFFLAGFVMLPPLYYVFIGLWRENWILLITGILFEIIHFSHVYGNLKM